MYQTRKLGKLEQIIAPPTICNVVVPTLLSLKQSFDHDVLEQAVLLFIKTQPNLRSGLKKVDCDLYFTPLVQIEDYFEVLNPEFQWKEVCLKYSNSLLRTDIGNFPPIKVFFIPQSSSSAYLIPVYAHYAADGTNGMTIVNDILTIYTKLAAGMIPEIKFEPPPSVDEMSAAAIPKDKLNFLFDNFVETSRWELSTCNFAVSFTKAPDTEALYYTSTNKVFDDFVAVCRSKNVTVGAAFTSAMFFSFAGLMFNDAAECPDEVTFGVNIPVNLRNRSPLEVEDNCCNLTVTEMLLTRSLSRGRGFWNFAQETREIIRKKMDADNLIHLFDFLVEPLIADQKNVLLEKFGTCHQFCVSNMRRYPGLVDYDDFTIESIHCVGGKWIVLDIVQLMIYSTNKFNLSLVHCSGEENLKMAKKIFKTIQYIVENPEKLDCELQDLIKAVDNLQ